MAAFFVLGHKMPMTMTKVFQGVDEKERSDKLANMPEFSDIKKRFAALTSTKSADYTKVFDYFEFIGGSFAALSFEWFTDNFDSDILKLRTCYHTDVWEEVEFYDLGIPLETMVQAVTERLDRFETELKAQRART